MVWKWILCILVGYLLGCFSTSVIVSKIIGKDIREYGSGNAGSTNMLRTFGMKLGFATLLGDILKSVIATLFGMLLLGDAGACVGGLASILGHDFPVFLKFKGGKGVASSCGVLFVIEPLIALGVFVLAVLSIVLTKIVSINSMLGAVAAFIAVLLFNPGNVWHIVTVLIIAVLIIARHHANIKRLLNGTENKLDFTKIGF
ncbi:MAG: glycerol-3-phosphate 1-O-acyltransferase PlsY [Bacillota bacterium]